MFLILVVDDNPGDVSLLKELMKTLSRPYHIDWVQDGSEALDFLFRRGCYANAMRPNLVLMDMNMPRLTGLEALDALKSDPELRMIPVIMLSSSTLPAEVRQSYQAHVNCYVQKPMSLEQSLRLVRAIEAFWIDFVILPSADGYGSSTVHSTVSGPTWPNEDHGPLIAHQIGEVRSPAITTIESPAKESALPRNADCKEHRRLLDEFGAAVQELLRLHEHQYLAIVQSDTECNRFDLLIHMANEKKQLAKYAYIRHAESHGCSNFDALNKTRT